MYGNACEREHSYIRTAKLYDLLLQTEHGFLCALRTAAEHGALAAVPKVLGTRRSYYFVKSAL